MGEVAKVERGELVVDMDISEFGLEMTKAIGIQQSFLPRAEEYKGYQEIYNRIIKSEITPELCEEAKELKNKLVKVRTGVDRIHKVEKAYYYQAGKFVDTLKNKIQEPGKQMEEVLGEIADHYKIIEAKRLEELQKTREAELSKYVEDVEGRDLSSMEDDVWEAFVSMQKGKYEARIAEEKKAEEARLALEKIEALRSKRSDELRPFYNFITEEDEKVSLGEMSEEDFKKYVNKLKALKEVEDKRVAEQAKENERLKKEAEALAAKVEAERMAAAEELAKQETEKAKIRAERSKLMQPYLNFIKDYEAMISSSDSSFEKQLADIQQAWKDQQAHEAKEKAKKEKADKELLIKQLKEAELEKEEKLKRELAKKSESDQIKAWVESFTIPNTEIKNAKVKEIQEKFEGFKAWAQKLADS